MGSQGFGCDEDSFGSLRPRRPPRHQRHADGHAEPHSREGRNTLKIGERGMALIKSHETLQLTAYRPTKDDVWTIGYGHTKGVTEGITCTEQQAEAWLLEDLRDAET